MAFILGGLFFFGIGLFIRLEERRFFKKAIMLEGAVVDYQTRRDNKDHSMTYTPVVEFVFDGQMRRVTGSVYSSTIPQKGKIMPVGIDPQDINKVRLKQKSSLVLSVFFMVAGALTMLCGLAVFFQ